MTKPAVDSRLRFDAVSPGRRRSCRGFVVPNGIQRAGQLARAASPVVAQPVPSSEEVVVTMGKRITAEELDKRLRRLGKRSGWTLISMRIDVCGDGEDRDAIVEARYRESEYRLCCSIGPGLMPGPLVKARRRKR